MEPTFPQIWTRHGWSDYRFAMRHRQIPHRSQTYYQIRSLVRIAFWISYLMVINQVLGWVDSW